MAATQLRITQHPGGAVSGANFAYPLKVEFRDAANQLVATETSTVTVTVASGTGVPFGTASMAAVGGVANFAALGITGTALHSLTVTSGVLPTVTTRPFNVLPAGLPTSGVPNLALLPVSNKFLRNVAALNSLNITGGTASGTRFREPVSGVWGEKISDYTTPVATTVGCDTSYSSMGNSISHPWVRGDGKTVRTLYLNSDAGGQTFLIDHVYGTGVDVASKRAILTSGGKTVGGPIDTKFSFSDNPATPTICYFADGGVPGKLLRYDARTNDEAPTGNFTAGGKTFSTMLDRIIGEVMHSFDDRYFVIASSGDHYDRMLRWDSQTNTEVVFDRATRLTGLAAFDDGTGQPVLIKQGYLDRVTGRHIAVEFPNRTFDGKAMFLWDAQTDQFTVPLTTTNHSDWVGGSFVSQDTNGQFYRIDPAALTGPSPMAATLDPSINILNQAVVGNCFSQHRSGKWDQGHSPSLLEYQLLSLDQEGHTGKGVALGTTNAPYTLDSGSVYKQTPSFNVGVSGQIPTVAQFGINTGRYAYQLEAAASRVAMTEGTFFYDPATTTLYVWGVGSPDLRNPIIGTATAVAGGSMTAGTYQYWVAALTPAGETVLSAPNADYNGGVTVGGANLSATVTWTAYTGATGYRVYRRNTNKIDQIQEYFSVGAVTSFTDTGTAPSAGYPIYAPMGVSPNMFDAAATFLRSDGLDYRYLATFGSNSFQYWGIPVVSISPDGCLVMGKSSMGYPDGAPQVFVFEVPLQSGVAPPAPPAAPGTLPTPIDQWRPKPTREGLRVVVSPSTLIGTGGLVAVASNTVSVHIPVGRVQVSVLSLAIDGMVAAAGSGAITVTVNKVTAASVVTPLTAATSIKSDVVTTAGNIALPMLASVFGGAADGSRKINGTVGDYLRVDITAAGTVTTQPQVRIVAELGVTA